jgi:hypothetical protein
MKITSNNDAQDWVDRFHFVTAEHVEMKGFLVGRFLTAGGNALTS